MRYMRVTSLRKVLQFSTIWFINDKFVGTKLRWVIPPSFEAPSSETTGRTQKVNEGTKNGTDMLYPCLLYTSDAADE